jgi:hypothetical protein
MVLVSQLPSNSICLGHLRGEGIETRSCTSTVLEVLELLRGELREGFLETIVLRGLVLVLTQLEEEAPHLVLTSRPELGRDCGRPVPPGWH